MRLFIEFNRVSRSTIMYVCARVRALEQVIRKLRKVFQNAPKRSKSAEKFAYFKKNLYFCTSNSERECLWLLKFVK